MNYGAMLASLKMGVDILTAIDPDTVPHTKNPNHIPVYTLRQEDGTVMREGHVDELVESAHGMSHAVLCEDEYPVFGVGYA